MQASYHDTHKPVEGSPSRLWLSNRLASLSRFVARTGTRLGSWLDRLSLTVIR